MATKPVNGGNPSVFAPITPTKTGETGETQKAKAVVPSPYAGQTGIDARKGDASNVQISTTAKDRAEAQKKAFDIAKATPEIREDRVADIKARLAAGTYEIDSGKIADGMLREAIMEHLAEGEE